jgi:hypothetical protein
MAKATEKRLVTSSPRSECRLVKNAEVSGPFWTESAPPKQTPGFRNPDETGSMLACGCYFRIIPNIILDIVFGHIILPK